MKQIFSRKYPKLFTTVDDDDYEHIKDVTWTYIKGGKWIGKWEGKPRYLSQVIMYLHRGTWTPNGWHVEHLDKNPLNNTYLNLIISSYNANYSNDNKWIPYEDYKAREQWYKWEQPIENDNYIMWSEPNNIDLILDTRVSKEEVKMWKRAYDYANEYDNGVYSE